jgi:quercetin dioxygenase-like cupin family protein
MKTRHTFCVSRSTDATWSQGLRNFFEYRELGINEATNGQYNVQILRVRKPVTEFPHTGPHTHDLDFQMIFVLKGWIRFTYEDQGEFTFREGDSCLQPPGIVHDEIALTQSPH